MSQHNFHHCVVYSRRSPLLQFEESQVPISLDYKCFCGYTVYIYTYIDIKTDDFTFCCVCVHGLRLKTNILFIYHVCEQTADSLMMSLVEQCYCGQVKWRHVLIIRYNRYVAMYIIFNKNV